MLDELSDATEAPEPVSLPTEREAREMPISDLKDLIERAGTGECGDESVAGGQSHIDKLHQTWPRNKIGTY